MTGCLPTKSTSLRQGMIVGMGNSMLDLIGNVGKDVLDRYKLIANHAYMAEEEHMPLFKELLEKYNGKYVVGGSVQNTLCVTQWVLGVPKVCIMFSGIGCDEEGKILCSKAITDGIDAQYQYIRSKPTGICAVLLTDNGAERTLVANLSAAKYFTVDHLLKKDNKQRLHNACITYISGFFLAVSVEAAVFAAKCAYESNSLFIMNLSATYLAEQYMNEWLQVMPYVDVLFGNDTEARSFAKEHQFIELHDVHKIALELSCLPKFRRDQERIVIITQGPGPVLVAKDGVIKEHPVPKLDREKVVDSTGAGDAFVGGFLAQLVQNVPIEKCVSCGIWCASLIIQQEGCSLEGLPKYTS